MAKDPAGEERGSEHRPSGGGRTPPARPSSGGKFPPAAYRALSLLAGLAVWAVVGAAGIFQASLFPPPWDVGRTMLEMIADGSLLRHIVVSLSRVFLGFFLAAAAALPLGIAMGLYRWCHSIVDPVLEFLRPVPPLALIPLAVVWFGIGWSSKVFLIAYGCFFAIVLNTVAGVRAVEPIHLLAARSLGASRWQIFRHVVLWTAVPDIVVGLRLAMGLAFLLIVGAEIIASSSGLGWLIWDARFHFMGDRILVGMIAIGIVGYCLNRLLLALERRLVRWGGAGGDEGLLAGL